jgi:hypothetical protein
MMRNRASVRAGGHPKPGLAGALATTPSTSFTIVPAVTLNW